MGRNSGRDRRRRRSDESESESPSESESDSDRRHRSGSHRTRRDSDGDRRKKKSSRNITEEEIAQYMAKKAQTKAMKVAKKLKTSTVSGYSNDSNPFGDSNLNEKFVWRKKIERDVSQGVSIDTFSVKAEKKRQIERMAEIEKVKKRREERALEKARHEEEMALLARERARAEFQDWEKKEEEFHFDQSKVRSEIRLREGRARPIDVLTKHLNGSDDLDIEINEPYMVFKGLTVNEMTELRDDIKMHLDLDRATPTHVEYWEALLLVCDWELAEVRKKDALDRARVRGEEPPSDLLAEERGLHSSVEPDVKRLLLGKTHAELEALQVHIESEMRSGTAKVVEYWEAILKHLHIYKAKACLKEIWGCVPALGADQFDEKKPKERIQLASFFNWFLFSITVGASIGVIFVVYVSTEYQWYLGFIMSLTCSAAGLLCIFSGKRFYRTRVSGESPLLSVLQVLVVTIKNWRVKVPVYSDELYEIQSHESNFMKKTIPHTNQFSVLDKAAVLPEGIEARKWKVCTVTQVEEVKILTRMMPILLSTIIMNTCLAQLQTFSIQQGTLMNTYIGKLNIPAASIPIIPLVFMTLLIPVYEFVFVPFVRRITGHPNGITELQRVGVGLVLSAISMVIAGMIEVKRKHEFNDHNQHRISLFWLSFHYAIFGIADMFTLVGLLEFFYKEAPQGVRSLSTSFSFLSLSIGYYLSTAFVELINLVTRIGKSKKGWLEGRDLNQNHVELFYWFLAILSMLNFLLYLLCAKWYKYQTSVPFESRGMLHKDPPPRNDENMSTIQSIASNEEHRPEISH